MRRSIFTPAFSFLAVICVTMSLPLRADARPRIIATTDGEIDDRCSMVRFLLYANEWDIEGIIYNSSKFHWKGHRWAGEQWIEEDIARYESFYDTLKQHAQGFPTPDELRKLVWVGNIDNVGEMGADTPGSNRIIEVLLDSDPGPVYLQAWGGTNTIARALWKIQHEQSRSDCASLREGHHLHHPRPGHNLPRIHPAELARPSGSRQHPPIPRHSLSLARSHSREAARLL